MKRSLRDLDVQNKRVLVRIGLDVPVNDQNEVTDDTRVEAVLPTISYLRKQGAKTILTTKVGRPGGEVSPKLSTKGVAARVSELLGGDPIQYVSSSSASEEVKQMIEQLPQGGVLMLENIQFDPRDRPGNSAIAKEGTYNKELAEELASLADVFVFEAFNMSHRRDASVVGPPALLPSAMGLSLEEEVRVLSAAIESPKLPLYVVMGGVKMETRIPMIKNFFENVGSKKIVLGGAMANTFFVAQGHSVGASRYEEEHVSTAKELLDQYGDRLVLPVDVVVADAVESTEVKAVDVNQIPEAHMALDVGPKTVEMFGDVLSDAQTIIWNGPMGVFEREYFLQGTKGVAEVLARSGADTIIGGGDTAAAVEIVGLTDAMTFVSTGGGASLALFEGKPLPGIEALDDAAVV